MTATTQAGHIQVLADILSEALDVVGHVEPESDDESRRLAMLLDRGTAAIIEARRPYGVNIDAAHFKLEG
jgi:hypothetical protein